MGRDRYTNRARRRNRNLAEKRKRYFEKEERKTQEAHRKARLLREAIIQAEAEDGYDRAYYRSTNFAEQL